MLQRYNGNCITCESRTVKLIEGRGKGEPTKTERYYMIDISDWRFAEPIFIYCQQDEQKAEINRLRENGYSLSMAEYVSEYRLADFEKWLIENEISIDDL